MADFCFCMLWPLVLTKELKLSKVRSFKNRINFKILHFQLQSLVGRDDRDNGRKVRGQIVLVILVLFLSFLHLVVFVVFVVFLAANADTDAAAPAVIEAEPSRSVCRVSLQVAVEIVPPAVALVAHGADVRPDALVKLLDVPAEAVELRKCFSANRSVVEDPPAGLLVVQPLLGEPHRLHRHPATTST